MGEETGISWCDSTFNPHRGCVKVSPGCQGCYAEALSGRNPKVLGVWGKDGVRVVAAESGPAGWKAPLLWHAKAAKAGTRPRVFCASLADVFEQWDGPMVDHTGATLWRGPGASWGRREPGAVLGEGYTPLTMDDVRWRLFETIRDTSNLDWLLLTKRTADIRTTFRRMLDARHSRMGRRDNLYWWLCDWIHGRPPANVWLGASVEDQKRADERIPDMLDIPAVLHWLSMEPLLGPVDLTAVKVGIDWGDTQPGTARYDVLRGFTYSKRNRYVLNGIVEEKGETDFVDCENLAHIGWVVVGGESGAKARPMLPQWPRGLRDQCQAADVPYHYKQWGEWLPDGQGAEHWASAIQGKTIRRLDGTGRDVTGLFGLHGEGDTIVRRIGVKSTGRMLDGRTWDGVPDVARPAELLL